MAEEASRLEGPIRLRCIRTVQLDEVDVAAVTATHHIEAEIDLGSTSEYHQTQGEIRGIL